MKNKAEILARLENGGNGRLHILKSAELAYRLKTRYDFIQHGIKVTDTLISLLKERGNSFEGDNSRLDYIVNEKTHFEKALKELPMAEPLYGDTAIELQRVSISITNFSYYVEGLDFDILRTVGYTDDVLNRVSKSVK